MENNCFQSHESNQLSTKIRISAHLFFHEKLMKRVIIRKNSYDTNDKVETRVKGNIKNLINFFKKVMSKSLKT